MARTIDRRGASIAAQRAVGRLSAVFGVGVALLALLGGASPPAQRPLAATPVPAGIVCPAQPAAPAGRDFHGQTLSATNFSGQDLRNANFAGATLVSPMFIRADLRGANFSGAVFLASQQPQSSSLPADFTLARLGSACFIGAQFGGVTYFTYADLTSTDFSVTDISNTDVVIFGTHLAFTPSDGATVATRPAFRSTVMSCDFVAQWSALDLTGATGLRACASQLKGFDFSGALMPQADLSEIDLSGTHWAGAVLERTNFEGATLDNATGLNGTAGAPARLAGARFNNASAVGVDFSNALLYGADFTYADLSNTSFAGSFLTSGGATGEPVAAKFDGARLRNASFASAKLRSASFVSANVYGSFPAGAPGPTCQTDTAQCGPDSPRTGSTCSCASMAGADLSSANFTGAFLWGVDFANPATVVNGTQFIGAILIGANFSGVNFRVAGGAPPNFQGAMLQGALLGAGATGLTGATLTGAFFDFEQSSASTGGNDVTVLLGSDHTKFRHGPGSTPACVVAGYNQPSTVPAQVSLDCPDGTAGVCGAGRPRPNPNPHWDSRTPLDTATPVPGWYALDATYDRAITDPSRVCRGAPVLDTW